MTPNLLSKDLILSYAWSFLGRPYRWAGAGPNFDCSGFVIEILKAKGIVSNKFDATSQVLYNLTLEGGTINPKAHCLAFYGKQSITHVAYCISETHVLEAGSGNSETLSDEKAQEQGAFIRLRPIHYRKDFQTIHLPDKSHFS